MSNMPPIDWSKVTLTDLTKGAVAVLLMVVAGYSFFKGQNEFGLAMIGNALYVGGAAADGLKLKGDVSKTLEILPVIASDTANLRDNPLAPGTPLTDYERIKRSAVVPPVSPVNSRLAELANAWSDAIDGYRNDEAEVIAGNLILLLAQEKAFDEQSAVPVGRWLYWFSASADHREVVRKPLPPPGA